MAKGKKKKSRSKKKKASKKRNYNEMLEDSKRLNNNEPNQDNITGNLIKISPRFKKENDNVNNISPNTEKTDIQIPKDYNLDKTYMPSIELIKSKEETRNLNIPIYISFNTIFNKKEYDNILKTLKIKEDSLLTQKIYGDGNCLFRCISYFLTGTEAYHVFTRNLLYNCIINHYEEIIIEFPYVYYNSSAVNTDEYLPLIQDDGNFGGELECNLFTKVISINILVLQYNEDMDGIGYFNYYMYYGHKNQDTYIPLCILEYKESKKHYQLLYYNKNFSEDIFIKEFEENKDSKNKNLGNENDKIINKIISKDEAISPQLKEFELNKNNYNNITNVNKSLPIDSKKCLIVSRQNNISFGAQENINKIEQNDTNLKNEQINVINKIKSLKNNLKNIIPQANIIKLNDCLKENIINIEKQKSEIINNKFLHNKNDYPIYPFDSDDPEGFYANIFNYLYNRNINKNTLNYPKYIYQILDENKKETKKRAFRKKAEKFEIDKFGYLCYKIPDNEENESSSSEIDSESGLEKEKKEDINIKNKKNIKSTKKELIKLGKYSLYKIPFQQNEYDLIKKIHEENNHRNWEDTRKEFKKLRYYYRGYINDIKYVISKCPSCYQKNANFYKRESCKTIVFDYPRDRYVLDLTDLPFNIDLQDKFKYLLNIIDHFSKLCKSYLLKNKEAFGILQCVKNFISIYGLPRSIGTDNGREFKNKLFTDYMEENKIQYVHGLPYKPHSQGVCEIVHKTIKVGLIVKKLEDKKKFVIKEALDSTISAYNNTLHNVTKATPLEIFYSTNKKFLKKIKQNIINYYNKRKKNTLELELDDKVLISSNILIKRNKKDNLILIEKNKIKNEKHYIIYVVL